MIFKNSVIALITTGLCQFTQAMDKEPSAETIQIQKQACFKKPSPLLTHIWLQKLETARDETDFKHDLDTYEHISREIGSTITGKYGLTDFFSGSDHTYQTLSSIVKTRTFYKGMPDILQDIYFAYSPENCWKKIKESRYFAKHIAKISIVDTVSWALQNEWQLKDKGISTLDQNRFKDILATAIKTTHIPPDLTSSLLNLMTLTNHSVDDEKMRDIFSTLSSEEILSLLKDTQSVLDYFAPSISFLDIYTCDFSSFEDKGWTGHKVEGFSTGTRESDEDLKESKELIIDLTRKNMKRYGPFIQSLVRPMTPRAVLLTEENKEQFSAMPKDVPFDGSTVAIEYRFFHPDLESSSGSVIPEPISFYITRPLEHPALKPLLSKMSLEEIDEKSREYQDLAIRLQELLLEQLYDSRYSIKGKAHAWGDLLKFGLPLAYLNYAQFIEEAGYKDIEKLYKRAADQGCVPAFRHYHEYLKNTKSDSSKLASYFKMAGLMGDFHKEAHSFAPGLLFEPPFLEALFENVGFSPNVYGIKLKPKVDVKDGNLEIHFRDSSHLRELMESIPLITAKNLIWVQDNDAHQGKEFVPISGELTTSSFIHFMAEGPVKLSGTLDSPYYLIVPSRSDINALNLRTKGGGYSCGMVSYELGHELAKTLEVRDENKVHQKTFEANSLFDEKRRDRRNNPHLYPQRLGDITPDKLVISDGHVRLTHKDYLHSKTPIVYMAPTQKELEELKETLPPFLTDGGYIYLIDKSFALPGIFSFKQLKVQKGIEIESDKNLVVAGELNIPDYNVALMAQEDLWCLGLILKGNNMYFSSKNVTLMSLSMYEPKPKKLPQHLWNKVKSYFFERQGLVLGD